MIPIALFLMADSCTRFRAPIAAISTRIQTNAQPPSRACSRRHPEHLDPNTTRRGGEGGV